MNIEDIKTIDDLKVFKKENNITDEMICDWVGKFNRFRLNENYVEKLVKKYGLMIEKEQYKDFEYGYEITKMNIDMFTIGLMIVDFGIWIKDKVVCWNCKTYVNENDDFCMYCGSRVIKGK